MTPELEAVIRHVREQLPLTRWEQLPVKWPADDDGLWFFWIPGRPGEVQIESSGGGCPFLIETDKHDDRATGQTPDETADTIVKWLQLPGGRVCGRPGGTS